MRERLCVRSFPTICSRRSIPSLAGERIEMAIKRTPLTKEQFRLIKTTSGWNIDEVPREHWSKIPGLQRLDDTIGVMASGCSDDPKVLNNIKAIAGMDVLVHETNPIVDKDEKEGNAYHYVIQKINDDRFPSILHGPIKSETIVPHWFEAEDLNVYWEEDPS